MGAMQEALMEERFSPGAGNGHWVVCWEHCKQLRNGVWEAMEENPPDTVRIQNTRCDACLTEETWHVNQSDRLRTADLSYVTG